MFGFGKRHNETITLLQEIKRNQEEILQRLTQIEEAIDKLDLTDMADKLHQFDLNVNKVNTMALELKGMVAMVRATLPERKKAR